MVALRAVGAGVLAFPILIVWAAFTEPFALLVVGFVPGALPAAFADPVSVPASSTDCSSAGCVRCSAGRCSSGG